MSEDVAGAAGGEWRVSAARRVSLARPVVLAILNLTPDSFSDGGTYPTIESALEGARAAVGLGADALDIGGESTRPGARAVPEEEQIRRTAPLIAAIRRERGLDHVPITIDTTRSAVAAAAIEAGADGINDVSGGTEDEGMLRLAAGAGAGVVLMHRLATPERDVYSDRYGANEPDYSGAGGVVGAVRAFLAARVGAALAAGVAREGIVVDPGLGFGKTVGQNLELIRRTGELASLGYPVLSGLSRKSFTARAGGLAEGTPARERLAPTIALTVAHLAAGARIFRVHDVGPVVEALRAAEAARRAGDAGGG
ncbi:MAG: dihydropteroate synthase [Phycisphaeraceae bacterium]|nr:dihydropteroate synthase [Phycisphaeraceae bacterium]